MLPPPAICLLLLASLFMSGCHGMAGLSASQRETIAQLFSSEATSHSLPIAASAALGLQVLHLTIPQCICELAQHAAVQTPVEVHAVITIAAIFGEEHCSIDRTALAAAATTWVPSTSPCEQRQMQFAAKIIDLPHLQAVENVSSLVAEISRLNDTADVACQLSSICEALATDGVSTVDIADPTIILLVEHATAIVKDTQTVFQGRVADTSRLLQALIEVEQVTNQSVGLSDNFVAQVVEHLVAAVQFTQDVEAASTLVLALHDVMAWMGDQVAVLQFLPPTVHFGFPMVILRLASPLNDPLALGEVQVAVLDGSNATNVLSAAQTLWSLPHGAGFELDLSQHFLSARSVCLEITATAAEGSPAVHILGKATAVLRLVWPLGLTDVIVGATTKGHVRNPNKVRLLRCDLLRAWNAPVIILAWLALHN